MNDAVFQLIRILMWSVVYGLYVVLSTVALYLIVRYGSRYSGRFVVIAYTLFMMMAITGWYAVSVALAVQTLLGTLSATCSALCVTQEVCDTIMVLAGDALLLYRTITIWKRDFRVVAPLCAIYGLLTGFGILSHFVYTNNPDGINTPYTCFMGVFLGFNILAPALIAYHLWKSTRDTALGTASSRQVTSVLRILAQTIVLWALAAAAFLTTQLDDATSHEAAVMIADIVQELVMLIPACIIFDIALREYREAAAARASDAKALAVINTRRFAAFSVLTLDKVEPLRAWSPDASTCYNHV